MPKVVVEVLNPLTRVTELDDRYRSVHLVFKVGCVEIRVGTFIDDQVGLAVLLSGKNDFFAGGEEPADPGN